MKVYQRALLLFSLYREAESIRGLSQYIIENFVISNGFGLSLRKSYSTTCRLCCMDPGIEGRRDFSHEKINYNTKWFIWAERNRD